ncbi:CCR4-NOT transcription complex subunit 6-like isoform X2 [Bombus affinis]|uniref:poly(A)-specific ribonuclease n=1 Tax=Bombus terrestris TaxID=30195 RepID=A0A9B2JKZ7_BOMTE|nr:CCR4-NOT transcription complex subunit 6-like isoform X2 [Bombus terrestris]XP_050593711.1 CCR4-NOT transcription complex subunit 6-like isoform X2 [Bombus affinis]XP_050593712.1 CCR4-NOT transcription complex subunit 6-like isoform X2 [Bombus affinis]XP_050593721.1 CCR4-NOT transcription complex subunit 6-like isoform X2 [Bombus affinis]
MSPIFIAQSVFTANHPPQRPWIPLTRPNRTRPTCIFTVMCYNVLCDKYATRQMYGYCPSWALDWEYRKKGILDEIRHYAADIISLQEVETDQFYNFFLPELKHDGYDGIFSPKSRAKTMAENDRKYVDGCAIFYRTAKFTLIKEHLVEFNQLAMANAEGSDNMLNRVMPKDNIGLAALLRTKEAAWDNGLPSDPAQVQQPILVCTAHIHWDPEFCDVKLIQTMMLSNELRSILDQAGQSFRPGHKPDSSNVQLLLCGDFNSLPDSGVIEFLTSGRVAADHRDFKDLAYKSCLQKISGCDKPNEFTHSFKLASAYSEDIMPYTNYTFEFKGIIDYIFYSKQSMVPLGLLGPLSADWFKEHKVVGCPHPHVPSDHFPLLVELEMTPTVGTSNGLISRR